MSAHQTWFARSIGKSLSSQGQIRCPGCGALVRGVRSAGARGAERWCAAPARPPEDPEGASAERPGGARSAPPRGADAEPSGGRRRTDTSETARRSGASAPASPRSRPSARSRATSARSTAGGIAGSGSTTDGRAPPSPDARPGSSTGPARQKIPLHDQLPNPGVKLPDLALVIPAMALDTVREHLAETRDRLPLPTPDLVRMNLVPRGNLLKRPIAPKRLQGNLRLLLP